VIAVENADGTTPGEGDTDNPIGPVTDSNNADNTISENAVIGQPVGITALATDPDGDNVSYELVGDNKDLFAINANGVITLAGNLDFETAESHTVTVKATSTDGTTSQADFVINVENADGTTPGDGDTDNPIGPVTDTNAADNTISENAAIGQPVGITALATDPDGDNVSYELVGDNKDLFSIDANGVITLAGELDFEVAESHT
ncbi:cadherin repeat domain-containing protein, partial [Psychrobium sp. 1_MG-2023]|uniref:cadherin repeat domain-containing protein n=1 Tax=Psychrobium sp. 1_MG-2023 TaxID=3062624 RepID=UPI0027327ECB